MRRTATRTNAMSIEVRVLLWTALGVVVAAVIGLGTVLSTANAAPPPALNQVGTASSGGTVINNNGYMDFQQQVPPGVSDDEVRRAAAAFADVPPPSDGPAPFRVVDTQDHGLKVRTTPDLDGVQIGSAANGTTLWVDCATESNFDPQPGDGAGPRWLRVRWPSAERGSTFRNSDPASPLRGWVYAGFTVPAGHDGQIRAC